MSTLASGYRNIDVKKQWFGMTCTVTKLVGRCCGAFVRCGWRLAQNGRPVSVLRVVALSSLHHAVHFIPLGAILILRPQASNDALQDECDKQALANVLPHKTRCCTSLHLPRLTQSARISTTSPAPFRIASDTPAYTHTDVEDSSCPRRYHKNEPSAGPACSPSSHAGVGIACVAMPLAPS